MKKGAYSDNFVSKKSETSQVGKACRDVNFANKNDSSKLYFKL